MYYEFELGHNAVMEKTENISCMKSEDAIDHSNQEVEEILLKFQKPE